MPLAGPPRKKPQSHSLSENATERKQTEEALRKSEERWRSVFENSAIGVALTDLNGRFLATNPLTKDAGLFRRGISNGFLSRDYS
jgi:PAS domain-containing protein